ncbi:MAG: LysM peptidoglycan-binding domain-containing protein [Proteobacteria bacterium]|nr:LysM peptidoglycan-binding domain-containing protein [Desulfobacterales bacterium]MBU0733368.1 LysM peptidoglycan-binding domain-containing protein [Pseudomonadota bacterium]MBU1903466.1 LysM peptidoglycan-binding domain-containing protein [Pseudomonadota bacterium]
MKEQITEAFARDQIRARQNEGNIGCRESRLRSGHHVWPVVLLGAAIFLFLTGLFSGCLDEKTAKEQQAIMAKIREVEKRLTKLEAAGEKVALLETQVRRLQEDVAKLGRPVEAKPAAQPVKQKVAPPDKKNYHVVRRGENLFGIAKRYGMTIDDLCRLNKITPKTTLYPGKKLQIKTGNKR